MDKMSKQTVAEIRHMTIGFTLVGIALAVILKWGSVFTALFPLPLQ